MITAARIVRRSFELLAAYGATDPPAEACTTPATPALRALST